MLAQNARRLICLTLSSLATLSASLADNAVDSKLTPLEHNNRGVCRGAEGNWKEAIEEAETAVAKEPTNKVFRTNLSAAHLKYADRLIKEKAVNASMIEYKKALFVDPANGPAENSLNSSYKLIGQDPSTLKCHADAARAAEAAKDFEQAAADYGICAHIEDSGYNNFKHGQCLLKGGNRDKAYYFLEYALMRPWLDSESAAKAECEKLFAEKKQ